MTAPGDDVAGLASYGLPYVAALIRDYDLVARAGDTIVVAAGEAAGGSPVVIVEAMGRRAAADADLVLGFSSRCRVTLLRLAGADDLADMSEAHPLYDLVAVFGLMVDAALGVGARAASSFVVN